MRLGWRWRFGSANAAREIALALGVPPMLLGIPGDNTYSNMAEAQRILWRQTVLPIVSRVTTALSNWLGVAENMRFEPDINRIEALSPERDARPAEGGPE